MVENQGEKVHLTDEERSRLQHVIECELWTDEECCINSGVDREKYKYTQTIDGIAKRVFAGDPLYGHQVYIYKEFIHRLMYPHCQGPFDTGCPQEGVTALHLMNSPEVWLCESCYDSLPEEHKI